MKKLMKISLIESNSFLAETCDDEIGRKSTIHSGKLPRGAGEYTGPFQIPGTFDKILYPFTFVEASIVIVEQSKAPLSIMRSSGLSSLHDARIKMEIVTNESRNVDFIVCF